MPSAPSVPRPASMSLLVARASRIGKPAAAQGSSLRLSFSATPFSAAPIPPGVFRGRATPLDRKVESLLLFVLSRVWALLFGMTLIMIGNGLHSTLLAVRGAIEGFGSAELSVVMSGYF